jgi:putative membrane-bound dehydrogenase-like protein
MKRNRMQTALALVTAAAAAASATPAQAQYFPTPAAAEAGRPAALPKSGTVSASPALEAKMRSQVTVPAGFDLTLFAGPPVALYPTCVAESPDGAIYVCADPNSSLSRIPGIGRVMRLVDENNDGKADRYTVFAEMDSPRGIVADGETVYVMYPPKLTAYRDTNGDGIADWSKDLVTGLGYGLDFRGADHTTNGIAMGIDGWIYVAVGDYGFQKAIGADGTAISQRGGAVVRVRPDGSNLEIYATGMRNIYDVAIDPFLNVYSRDNTNDGDGWNTRLHYIPAGAFLGYPTHYANFATEHFPTMFDYGGGSGVGDLWVQDPAWPEPYRNTLLTADWTVNQILRHPLTPKGASFEVQQQEFIRLVRPTDLVMDARSNLYVSTLSGGQFRYVADTIGYVFRVTPTGVSTTPPAVRTLTEAQLVATLRSGNAVHRMHAQRELLRRGASEATRRSIEQLVGDNAATAEVRVAAMFTLKQLAGAGANRVLAQAATASDARVRASALRALTDRKDQLEGVNSALFVQALSDADDHVKAQALNGLARLGAVDAAPSILPLTASADQGLSHLAVAALVSLKAADAALRAVDSGSPAVRAGALRVLGQLHQEPVVSALVDRLGRAQDAARRTELLQTLARLYNREAPWAGDWWTTRPSFIGPYYVPAAWEASARIRPVLRQALASASGEEQQALADAYVRYRVLPQGAQPLVTALGASRDPAFSTLVEAMVGRSAIDADQTAVLVQLSGKSPALKGAVAELLAKQPTQSEATLPLLRAAALDASLSPTVRESALNGIGLIPGVPGTQAAAPIFAQVNPRPGTEDTPVDAGWRRWVGNNRRGQELDFWVAQADASDPEQRVLAYSVILQRLRATNVQPAVRDRLTPILDAAWADPARAQLLARAVRIMRLETQYTERLRSVPAS